MEARRAFTSATRTFSSSALRERLTSLTTTPLKPVAKLHANIAHDDFHVLHALVRSVPRSPRFPVSDPFIPPLLCAAIAYRVVDLKFDTTAVAIPCVVSTLDKARQESREWFEVESVVSVNQAMAIFLRVLSLVISEDMRSTTRPTVCFWLSSTWGAICTFATESSCPRKLTFSRIIPTHLESTGTGFSNQFPGIVPHLLTLTSNFQIPFYREVILALGICSVSKQSCSNILKGGPGQSITIVVGGAAESLSARPGTADLTLRKRLGFIKVAIQHGADLVPVFSFGENDVSE
ncbi:hypothetical protein NLI96_g6164 [Meripilus lineatus]|uniref:diacylglycerol O-acyltransferase n=1 Tax=Meripilus lineatus TaxID=2056292 RepID=A0AAD5V1F7_9APHY|nr:hypothetical protein NLI96_g6164 [Physisporinus lineatus]